MAYAAPWPGPPASVLSTGPLATLQLVGDVQTNWEFVYPDLSPHTAFDAMGRDMADNLLAQPADTVIQMGDVSNELADKATILARFDLYQQWIGDYGLDVDRDWYTVCGNHDVVGYADTGFVVTPQEWADHWGYPGPSYVIDLDQVRVLVVGPTGEYLQPPHASYAPVRPLTDDDVTWIDARLDEDTRPTILAVHAPLSGFADRFQTEWNFAQSTVSAGVEATDLRAVINDHDHCIGWVHGHTHDDWDNATPPNTSVFDIGSRDIAVVDASAIFTKPDGVTPKLPTSFYVSVLDDGKTLEVRWRSHHKRLWDAIGDVRFHRLTAT